MNATTQNCDKCQKQDHDHLVVSDHIGLTTSLVKYWESKNKVHDLGVDNLDKENVIPFLVRNLHWRVANVRDPQPFLPLPFPHGHTINHPCLLHS